MLHITNLRSFFFFFGGGECVPQATRPRRPVTADTSHLAVSAAGDNDKDLDAKRRQ